MQTIIRIQKWWQSERGRHVLWLPVGFAMGIAAYFAWAFEPRGWAVAAVDGVMVALTFALWRRASVRPFLLMLLMIAAGFSWATLQTARQDLVVIAEAMDPRLVRGEVRAIERTADGFRLTLDAVVIEDMAAKETPQRVRLTIRPKRGSAMELPAVGTPVEIRAGLLPPMGPALPGAFDFARYFYFNGIGAVGFGLPPLKVVAGDAAGSVAPSPLRGGGGGGREIESQHHVTPPSLTLPARGRELPSQRQCQSPHQRCANSTLTTLHNQFWTWRTDLTDRILRALGPETGPIAAGLITGDARAMTDENFDELRASNLYHIVAISGEHMVIISGVIFLLLRWLTLLLPQRWRYLPEMKSWAAAVTLALVTVYLFITGLPVSAVRAYLMITLVLLAIIARRQVNPMRSLAIAALLMLIYQPAELFDPGFQLSFAATIAIIALVEWWQRPAMRDASRLRKLLHGLLAMLLISVVAEAATAPFVLSQFNTLSPYGVLANMLATPLVSFVLMPLVALFFLLLPLGFEHVALMLMDHGVRALLWIAHTVSHWPHALQAFPSPPAWAMAVFAFALVWMCIWQKRPRWLAAPFLILAPLSLLTVDSPDMLIGAELKQLAFRHGDGYVLARGRETALLPQLWAHGLGHTEFVSLDEGDPAWRCDPLGCVATVAGHRIAFPTDPLALTEDCAMAEVVVSSLAAVRCHEKTTINGDDLKQNGIHALWFRTDGLHIESTRHWQHPRPWNGG